MKNNQLRFKHILKKVNNTGNPDWGHYEKHWLLQSLSDSGVWEDVPDVYFVSGDDGVEREISFEEYTKLMNHNK